MNYPMYNPSVLDQFVEDTAEHFTDDLSDAMYLFPDGRMTSSTLYSIRSDDHNVLTTYFDLLNRPDVITLKLTDTDAYNNIVTQALGAITIVPETQQILKGSQQKLTDNQKQVITDSAFAVTDYVQNRPLTPEYLAKYRLADINFKNDTRDNLEQLSAPELKKSYQGLQQQIQQATSPQQKAQFKNQLNAVHQEISKRTQKQLQDFAKQNPKIKQPDPEPDQSLKR